MGHQLEFSNIVVLVGHQLELSIILSHQLEFSIILNHLIEFSIMLGLPLDFSILLDQNSNYQLYWVTNLNIQLSWVTNLNFQLYWVTYMFAVRPSGLLFLDIDWKTLRFSFDFCQQKWAKLNGLKLKELKIKFGFCAD